MNALGRTVACILAQCIISLSVVRSGTVYVKVQQSKDVGMCVVIVCVFLVCAKHCLCALYAVLDSRDALIPNCFKMGSNGIHRLYFQYFQSFISLFRYAVSTISKSVWLIG